MLFPKGTDEVTLAGKVVLLNAVVVEFIRIEDKDEEVEAADVIVCVPL